MKNFVVIKTKKYIFNNKTETFNVLGSESDCFNKITTDIEKEKVEWSNITDKKRKYEVNKTSDTVELIVHKNNSVNSNIVSTIVYKIIES